MKKLLAIVTVAASLSGLSTFGQGYFALSGPARGSWDIFTQGNPRLANTMNIGVMWGTAASTPLISSLMAGTPTNSASSYADNPWTALLSDPNFQFCVDNNTSLRIQSTTAANSAWVYTTTGGFSSVPVTGTSAGVTYKLFIVGWDKAYATPTEAANNFASVGWSQVFNYAAVDQIGTPSSIAQSGFVPFGVNVVPEPTAFALAGLGAAAMMIFRRRK